MNTIDAMNSQILKQVEDAVSYAVESPFPDPEDALEDVFSTDDTAALEV